MTSLKGIHLKSELKGEMPKMVHFTAHRGTEK